MFVTLISCGLPRKIGSETKYIIEFQTFEPSLFRCLNDKKFRTTFVLDGGPLKKCPLGFPADHPCIEDLRRTDFIAVADLDDDATLQKSFIGNVAQAFTVAKPFMRFLCDAMNIPF